MIIETADFNAGKDVALAAMDEFAQLCPGCTVELDGVTFPDWGNLGTRAQSALTANSDLTYFAPVFDGMTLPMVPAIIQAGAEDRVKIATFNASPDVMKLLKDGQVIAADVGNSNTHHGWAQIDVAFRLIAGAAPIESEKIRLRVFDATNIDSINIDDPEETWMGPDFPQAFRDGYKQLWGVA